MQIAVILAAAGCGSRMAAHENKVLLPLAGRPILCHSLERFQSCPQVRRILVTAAEGDLPCFRELLAPFDKARLCLGGETRQASIRKALIALEEERAGQPAPWDKVAVHDGARPLLSQRDWLALLSAGEQAEAALLVRPVTDTIKALHPDGAHIRETIPRAGLAAALTPQLFDYPLLLRAYAQAEQQGYSGTDDAELVERLGVQPLALPARDPNHKITYPQDLLLAEALLAQGEA